MSLFLLYEITTVSQKIGYMKFEAIMKPFGAVYMIAWFVWIVWGSPIIFVLSSIGIFIVGICLRLEFVKAYNITENGPCMEFAIALCCWSCSVCQSKPI